MWTPPNKHALPSTEDIKNCRGAMKEMTFRLEQAQKVVDTLTEELEALKVWIAPIRRLPFEILSLIFIEASKEDGEAPLALEQVCTRWRAYILDTPRAWTNIQLNHRFPHAVLEKYLIRSRHSPIHLDLVNVRQLDRVFDPAYHIYSLKIKVSRIPRQLWHVPTVKHLHIIGSVIADVDVTGRLLFGPLKWEGVALEYLSVGQVYLSPSYQSTVRQHFANLQHLVFRDAYDGHWITILKECASTLRVLEVTLFRAYWASTQRLHLPLVHHLEIEIYHTSEQIYSVRPFEATTPKLLSYTEFHFYPHDAESIPSVLHEGTDRVIHLHTNRIPDFAHYPSLCCLHLSSTSTQLDYRTIITADAKARSLCPKFQGIFVDQCEGEVVDREEIRRNGETSIMVDTHCTFEMSRKQ